MRFFFDYSARDRSLYDFHGEEFQTPGAAIEFGEAIVENLIHRLDGAWIGWQVEVRNAEGIKFEALPVCDEMAAMEWESESFAIA
jgi:hypothetical protein